MKWPFGAEVQTARVKVNTKRFTAELTCSVFGPVCIHSFRDRKWNFIYNFNFRMRKLQTTVSSIYLQT